LRLLYVSPERFNNERFLSLLGRARISLFAIDEAHCISEWGHAFRPDYLKLARTAEELDVPRVLALTATATPKVQADVCSAFGIAEGDATVTGFYRPNLNLLTTPVAAEERDRLLLSRLAHPKRPPGPTIVYVTLQHTAERVATMLEGAGHEAYAYHAGMDPEERARVQEAWTAGDRAIVVATIAFGMGIDKADVRYVYHYNLPKSLESWSQEIGRAGRDGKPSVVEVLACPDDVPVLENFAYGDTPTQNSVREFLREILSLGDRFTVSLYDLSTRHDIRQTVLKTLLTYLELDGVLRAGTPVYAEYRLRSLIDDEHDGKGDTASRGARGVVAAARKARQGGAKEVPDPTFVAEIFRAARAGSVWHTLEPDETAEAMGVQREKLVRAVGDLEALGFVEVKASRVRNSFSRVSAARTLDEEELCASLLRRLKAREKGEISRVAGVVALVEEGGCQVNALAAHFGQEREAPCGHCSSCRAPKPLGRGRTLPAPARDPGAAEREFVEGDLGERVGALAAEHPEALAEPRQQARFLCGITSPAATRLKLNRHPLFGALREDRFERVLRLCSP
jgi:ATP-dependent DNA helicase RecQ